MSQVYFSLHLWLARVLGLLSRQLHSPSQRRAGYGEVTRRDEFREISNHGRRFRYVYVKLCAHASRLVSLRRVVNRRVFSSDSCTLTRLLSRVTAFLHKKSWHTAGMAVQEDVWKRQQAAEHEKRRLEEFKKEIEEERKQQELLGEAIASGHVTKAPQERLEFMYKGQVGQAAPTSVDDRVIGKKRFDMPVEEGNNLQAQAEVREEEMHSKNEAWNKLNADPLLVMKQRELQSKQYITNNPVKMAQLKKESRHDRDRKRAKKDAKREERREKKRAIKREVREKYRRYDSDSRSRSRSPREERRRERSPRCRRDSRSRSPKYDRRSDRGHRLRRDSRSRRDSRDREGRNNDRNDRKRHRDDIKRDEAHAQDASKGYGLTYASERAEDAAAIRRDKRSKWRDEEAKRAPEREPETEWRGGNNAGHRTGRLSAEEKARRLASMSADANAHDEARIAKLRANVGELGGEMSFVDEAARAPDRHHSETPDFIAHARSSVYREPDTRRR